MTPEITRYRPPRARIAIAFSTKDRTDFTRVTIEPLIGNADVDLYWFDGSATPEGRALPFDICADRPAACEVHQNVVGGPDSAILYALKTLQPHRYDLAILVENDVLVREGWYEAMRASMERATQAGFRVGAASARVYAQRVLSYNGDHCLLLNSGAGFIALTPPAIDILLQTYRTIDGREFLQRFQALTGLDLQPTVEFHPDQMLCCDFMFDLLLYLNGYVVTAPPVTFVSTIDGGDHAAAPNRPVATPEDHRPETHDRLTRPSQIRNIAFPFFRFPRSRLSDRLLIGCHQLLVDVGDEPGPSVVQASGPWRRRWRQTLGPFVLTGSGRLRVTLYSGVVGLFLITGQDPVRFSLTQSTGHRADYELAANSMADAPMDVDQLQSRFVDMEILTGEVSFVGLTVAADALAYYANAQPSLDHIPA